MVPENPVIKEDMELMNRSAIPPKLVLNDRILILLTKYKKITFYDVMRQKFVAECTIDKVTRYSVVGDELVVKIGYGSESKRIYLPFSPKAKDGDFLFYTTTDSVFPNPFTSVNDFIPANNLQTLTEFACYESCWSSLHQTALLKNDGEVSKAFELEMPFFNDAKGYNLFTLLIRSKNV